MDRPDGTRLLEFWPKAIDARICEKARPALRRAGLSYAQGERRKYNSSIIGYYDEATYPLPPCRLTAFTAKERSNWLRCLPFINACDQVFSTNMPDRYLAQKRVAEKTPDNLIIGKTSFTTVTVNLWDSKHDAQTPVHTDSGDLPEGFGVLSALTKGDYTGGYLIFLRYGVAVDLRTTDVLLADVHEPHCNTPITPGSESWERIMSVFYFRTDMRRCPKKRR